MAVAMRIIAADRRAPFFHTFGTIAREKPTRQLGIFLVGAVDRALASIGGHEQAA